ncbi:probable E3 SUMO-protein ligase RNF212 isoform X1 [Ornithorhynchus anatinus]|uniref:probable E3 SUMO-protein ligase RNF212 isoform X1 n=2 Tax=Ornithorhynchus anatinus TaxID=9258 RepID=UPI0019D4C912|nr:probable E3 SUMO-protein ligase RNF212 isoform X1 [Ornithorhynchus anatinus]
MAGLAFCNRCFQPPRGPSKFSLTSCGHVYCDACLQKGKKDQCIICNAPCRTILLTNQVDFNIQAFFMDIDNLCKKYSKETSLISEFQDKQRGHLLAFYKEKTSKLEDSLKTVTRQMQQLERMNVPHRSAQGSVSKPVTSLFSTPTGIANGYSARSFRPPYSSASNIVDSMRVDFAPSPVRKPETPVAPVRISLISPPQGGRMGSVSYRGSGLTASQNRTASSAEMEVKTGAAGSGAPAGCGAPDRLSGRPKLPLEVGAIPSTRKTGESPRCHRSEGRLRAKRRGFRGNPVRNENAPLPGAPEDQRKYRRDMNKGSGIGNALFTCATSNDRGQFLPTRRDPVCNPAGVPLEGAGNPSNSVT